ncbi:MAG: metal-dependent hydrolase [Campylobacteraceae bacterium]|nr:metal-dependent hydrolase [Campylobacteraceae bacterium]
MKIIKADFILTCNEKFDILQNKAICFDEKIVEINDAEILCSKYPEAKFIKMPKNSILMSGLINPHVHLEFSANRSILNYGDFIKWLNSVIKNRDEIMELSTKKSMQNAINEMIKSGTTTIGAISSAGFDLEVCAKSKAKVVYFNEILGSNPSSADVLFEDFKNRLHVSLEQKSEHFFPAISVHSPYSTHPILAKKALQIAKQKDMIVSTHFMESFAEREWLDEAKGDFVNFFAPFNPYAKPLLKPLEYIELFKENKVLYTHCCYANDEELEAIKVQNATITHCPRSNRLLGCKNLHVKNILDKNINLTLGTDGYSSNNSLSIWDELRAALFLHVDLPLLSLAKNLLLSVTQNSSKALGVNSGSLEKGKDADFTAVSLEQIPEDLEQLPVQLILHVKKADKVFVNGEEIYTL